MKYSDSESKYAEAYKYETKKQAKSDYDDVKYLRDRYKASKDWLESSCYWGSSGKGFSDEGGNSISSSWFERRDLREKVWMGWFKPQRDDAGFKSNVKSPATTGRIESTMHKFMKLNIGFTAYHQEENDKGQAKIAKILLDDLFYRDEVRLSLFEIAKDMFIHGTGYGRVYWQREPVMLSFRKSSEKDLTKEEEKMLKERKVIWGKPEKRLKYDGIVIEPKPFGSIFPDPNCIDFHTHYRRAEYIIERRLETVKRLKALYGDNPNYKNLNKIKPTSELMGDASTPFYEDFSKFDNDGDTDLCEVLEMECEGEDRHMIVVGDIVIKDSPLPYDHKEYTYFKFGAIQFPHQYFGIGIVDLLFNHQHAEETLLNLAYDYMYRAVNMQYAVDEDIFGDFTESYMEANNQFIPTRSSGRPIDQMIHQLVPAPLNYDTFKLLEMTQRNQTLATQIDPGQMNLIQKNVTATATAINKENIDAFINAVLVQYGASLTKMGRQVWSLMQQKYTVPRAVALVGESGDKFKPQFRKVKLVGMKIVEDKTGFDLHHSDDFSNFETKPKYLNTDAELNIRIAPESLSIFSRGQKKLDAKEHYAQMLPNAVDPQDPVALGKHPNPLWNSRKLAEYYRDACELPEDMLLNDKAIEDFELESAKHDVNEIMGGDHVSGIPGRSKIHTDWESQSLDEITTQISIADFKLKEHLERYTEAGGPTVNPYTGASLYKPPKELTEAKDDLIDAQQRLREHLDKDSLPAAMSVQGALQSSQLELPQVPGMDGQLVPPMPQDPNMMMGQGMPMGMPGQPMMGMPGMQGSGGALPMPQAQSMPNLLPGYRGQ